MWLISYAIACVVMTIYASAIEASTLLMVWNGLVLVWILKGFIQIFRCRAGRHGTTVVRSLTEEWCAYRYCLSCDKEWFDPIPQALLPTGTHDELARFDEKPRPVSYSKKEWADIRVFYVLRVSIWYLQKFKMELEQGDEWKGEEPNL